MPADTVYTVSSATDHFREQARGGFTLTRCPDFGNFTSALPHHPASSFRLKNNDKVPHYVSREFRPPHRDAAALRAASSAAAVTGPHRHKHSLRPALAKHAPIVFIKSPKRPPPTARDAPAADAPLDTTPAARTIATQSDFRETEAQTDPFSPDAAPTAAPTAKAASHAALHHCGGAAELSHLSSLTFAFGHSPDGADVAAVRRLRAKRAFEASLPPLSDTAALPRRQAMLEAWESQEWAAHEAGIKAAQHERLALLQQAIAAREAEVEESHAERVAATTERLLAAKQGAFAALQKRRVKAIRHFMDSRKCGPRPRASCVICSPARVCARLRLNASPSAANALLFESAPLGPPCNDGWEVSSMVAPTAVRAIGLRW